MELKKKRKNLKRKKRRRKGVETEFLIQFKNRIETSILLCWKSATVHAFLSSFKLKNQTLTDQSETHFLLQMYMCIFTFSTFNFGTSSMYKSDTNVPNIKLLQQNYCIWYIFKMYVSNIRRLFDDKFAMLVTLLVTLVKIFVYKHLVSLRIVRHQKYVTKI